MIINKILTYDSKSYGQTAVQASDKSFGREGTSLADLLPGGWQVDQANIDQSGVAGARQTVDRGVHQGAL